MRQIVRDRILLKYRHRCANCGATERLEIDHIIPLSRGGRHDEDNFQVLCKRCNLRKGRGFDFRQMFRIGESADYIELDREYINQFRSYSSIEWQAITQRMFDENDRLFEVGS